MYGVGAILFLVGGLKSTILAEVSNRVYALLLGIFTAEVSLVKAGRTEVVGRPTPPRTPQLVGRRGGASSSLLDEEVLRQRRGGARPARLV